MNKVDAIRSSWQNSKAYLQHHLFTKDMSLLSKIMGDIPVDNPISLSYHILRRLVNACASDAFRVRCGRNMFNTTNTDVILIVETRRR